jgi:hypothetical protein
VSNSFFSIVLVSSLLCAVPLATPLHGASLNGEVAILTQGSIAYIGIDTGRADRKGLIDYGFVFASETPLPFVSEILKKAHIEYGHNYVRVISSSTRHILSLRLEGEPVENNELPAGFTTTLVEGFQLASYDLTTDSVPITNLVPSGVNTAEGGIKPMVDENYQDWPFPDPAAGGTTPTCRHGGKGTTECEASWSVGGYSRTCSVTCSSGYYACCNDYSCKCYPN